MSMIFGAFFPQGWKTELAGRLDFGVGAGWYDHEFKGYGYEFRTPAQRISVLEETVEIVKAMWHEPDTSYDGRWFHLDGAQCAPKPLQQPHPPMWIGGGGEQLIPEFR